MKVKNLHALLYLAVFYTTALIVSNVIAGKLIDVFGVVLTAGVFIFPVVYILDDVLPEVYGFQITRRIIWLAFAANAFAVAFFLLAVALPYPGFWDKQDAYATVLNFTPRLLLASFSAYLVGTHVNAWVMVVVKKFTGPRHLWTRTISSTLVGQAVDSVIFMSVAFIGVVPGNALLGMIAAQWAFKVTYEVLATPLTYIVVNYVKRIEGVDQFKAESLP